MLNLQHFSSIEAEAENVLIISWLAHVAEIHSWILATFLLVFPSAKTQRTSRPEPIARAFFFSAPSPDVGAPVRQAGGCRRLFPPAEDQPIAGKAPSVQACQFLVHLLCSW